MTEKKQWNTQSVGEALAAHIAEGTELGRMTREVYTRVIVGNSHEPLILTVNRNTEWIGTIKRFLWIFVTAILGALVAGFGAILTGLVSLGYLIFKIYPLLQTIDQLDKSHSLFLH